MHVVAYSTSNSFIVFSHGEGGRTTLHQNDSTQDIVIPPSLVPGHPWGMDG